MNRKTERKSVFVIEDDLSTSNLIERVLRSISPGIELEWCTSAEEAIEIINAAYSASKSSPFVLVISDFYLDGPKTGLDFWNFFHQRYPNVPFILMSSADLDDFMDSDESTSVPYFLKKPFDISQCRAFLSKFIKSGYRSHIRS